MRAAAVGRTSREEGTFRTVIRPGGGVGSRTWVVDDEEGKGEDAGDILYVLPLPAWHVACLLRRRQDAFLVEMIIPSEYMCLNRTVP